VAIREVFDQDGKLDVAGLTSALQGITDAVLNDSSVTKVVVK